MDLKTILYILIGAMGTLVVLLKDTSKQASKLKAVFLPPFLLFRFSDWLQGAYFFDVYSTKSIDGVPLNTSQIGMLFLTGFLVEFIVGPIIGSVVDKIGRKNGAIVLSITFALSAYSTNLELYYMLVIGRVFGGIGTALLFTTLEAWLLGEFKNTESLQPAFLDDVFGIMYLGDGLMAILAGLVSQWLDDRYGPLGPFNASGCTLLAAGVLVIFLWRENYGGEAAGGGSNNEGNGTRATNSESDSESENEKVSVLRRIHNAWTAIVGDRVTFLLGVSLSFFEGAMYVFVLEWVPTLKAAVGKDADSIGQLPLGLIFTLYMICSMVGATTFTLLLQYKVQEESFMRAAFTAASIAIGAVAILNILRRHLADSVDFFAGGWPLLSVCLVCFCIFEVIVGMYWPSIGNMRARHVPNNVRTTVMNVFRVPLNAFVSAVFLLLFFKILQDSGALVVAACLLIGAAMSQMFLFNAFRMRGMLEVHEPLLYKGEA